MGDADMAIDTGPALFRRLQMDFRCPGALPVFVHIVETVAVAAFPGVGTAHGFPHGPGQIGTPL